MNLIKPKNIKPNDTLAIIAPSGEVETSKIETAVKYFQSKGYKIVLGKNLFHKTNYLAGSDEERLEDLHWAFEDKSIDGIICARGGYGAIRLIKKINYDIVKENPKIFCGYSDITALSAMIFKKTGLITYSGAMAQSDFSNEETDKFTEESFWSALEYGKFELNLNPAKIYKNGIIEGNLLVGNLATFASLAGIDFIPNKKFVFAIEDINESVYKIDKYLHQLLNISKFRNNISAILLGDFLGADNEVWLDNLWNEISKELNIPVIGNLKISHAKKKLTLPFGQYIHLKI